jgi:hypothetical protein
LLTKLLNGHSKAVSTPIRFRQVPCGQEFGTVFVIFFLSTPPPGTAHGQHNS